MAYDVFLTYAPEDMDMANLVARRLRALKFKVRFNKKGEDPTFDDKDARDALKSQSMLVLWSENAVKSGKGGGFCRTFSSRHLGPNSFGRHDPL